jgi:diacylglycerol kinase (ATP)
MREARLIYNPAAGRGRQGRHVVRIVDALRGQGWAVTPIPTSASGQAESIARAAARSGAEAVFALGGDGHLREVAAGLLGGSVPMAPLPGGTTDVIARELGLGRDPLRVAAHFGQGRLLEIDVGLCGDRVFLMQATVGLDADILAHVAPHAKRRFGRWAIAVSGLARWWSYDYPEIHLSADGEPVTAHFAAVCNLSRYAGSLRLGNTSPTDRRLELVLFRGRGRRAALAFALDLITGRYAQRKDVEVRPVEEVIFRAPEDLPLQLDGDPVAMVPPVTVNLADQKLQLLLPAR